MYDSKTIEYAKELENESKGLSLRHYKPSVDDRSKGRNDYMRDYARILYSSSFRRLQGKMQLLGVDSTHFHRNRLTHSLEVAQIARTIGENLEINPVVCEAASLAHDIGNPPFGHHGEEVLNELEKEDGCGFEGNAQTFRILHRLEKKSHEFPGLNLTSRTLFAVTKYNQKRHTPDGVNKKFLYDEDWDFLNKYLDGHDIKHKKSIDAQVMDLADEIAYAAHDLEDAFSFRMVTIGEVLHEFYISDKYNDAYDYFSKIVQKCQRTALDANRLGTSEEYSVVLRKELTSVIVNTLCKDIGIVKENGQLQLGYKKYKLLAKGLKKLLFEALLRKRDIQLYEKHGEKVIRGLFEVYTDAEFNKDLQLLPPELRSLQDDYCKERLAIDYISGMMDSYAIKEYILYYGKGEYDKIYC